MLRSFVEMPYAAAFVDGDYFLENQADPFLDGGTAGAELSDFAR
ncbi:hypothetical protein [Occultella glacieicola]|nr:hypothetical protein [Occultella glacieicola]